METKNTDGSATLFTRTQSEMKEIIQKILIYEKTINGYIYAFNDVFNHNITPDLLAGCNSILSKMMRLTEPAEDQMAEVLYEFRNTNLSMNVAAAVAVEQLFDIHKRHATKDHGTQLVITRTVLAELLIEASIPDYILHRLTDIKLFGSSGPVFEDAQHADNKFDRSLMFDVIESLIGIKDTVEAIAEIELSNSIAAINPLVKRELIMVQAYDAVENILIATHFENKQEQK